MGIVLVPIALIILIFNLITGIFLFQKIKDYREGRIVITVAIIFVLLEVLLLYLIRENLEAQIIYILSLFPIQLIGIFLSWVPNQSLKRFGNMLAVRIIVFLGLIMLSVPLLVIFN